MSAPEINQPKFTVLFVAVLLATIGLIAVIFTAEFGWAHDRKALTDPDRGEWFESLKQPGTDISCCNQTDCHKAEAEWRGNQWWAVVETYKGKEWMAVPREKELRHPKSIDGYAYICNSPGLPARRAHVLGGIGPGLTVDMPASDPVIKCFVPPNMAM